MDGRGDGMDGLKFRDPLHLIGGRRESDGVDAAPHKEGTGRGRGRGRCVGVCVRARASMRL